MLGTQRLAPHHLDCLTGTLRRLPMAAAAVTATLAVAACGSGSASGNGAAGPVTLRLGYLTNLTHAPALIGVAGGYLQQSLRSTVTLKSQTFNAGPAEVEALFGGSLDAAYLGPNSVINAFTRSHGDAVRIVSGATSGGAELVVRADENIHGAADLRGKHIATPQLGNTQDVALRAWLLDNGLHTDAQGGGGDLLIQPEDNAQTLTLFEQGKLDGAWVPEPWASRLVDEGQGTVLVDEATLWPQGRFSTTLLAVSKSFSDAHPDVVKALVAGNQAAITWINGHKVDAEKAADDALAALTGKPLNQRVLDDAWSHLTFTVDPILPALKKAAQDAQRVGTVTGSVDLRGIVDPQYVNGLLRASGLPAIDTAGLAAT